MYDPAPQRGPMTPGERWTWGLFLLAVVGLFAAEIVYRYEPAKLSVLLFVLAWPPLLVLHELGHAVAARVLGWRVRKIVIGMGRVVRRFDVAGAEVELRLFALEGFVSHAPRSLRAVRIKSALIYFAGPGVELLLAAGLLLAVGPDVMFTRTADVEIIAVQSLALAAVFGAVVNLIPHGVSVAGGTVPNDGLGIIMSFLWPIEAYVQMAAGGDADPDNDAAPRQPRDTLRT